MCRAAVLAALLQRVTDPNTGSPFVTRLLGLSSAGCKGRLKSAAGGAMWRGGRKVRHPGINMEDVHRYGAMGRYTPQGID